MPDRRPFYTSFYLSLLVLYFFRIATFGWMFHGSLVSKTPVLAQNDSYKVLFTAYDAPKCIQTISTIFFIALLFHMEHECYFDSYELKKNEPISKFL